MSHGSNGSTGATSGAATSADRAGSRERVAPCGVWVASPESAARLYGMGGVERLRRSFDGPVIAAEAAPADAQGSWLVVRGDTVFDRRLLEALGERPGHVLVGRAPAEGLPVAAHVTSDDLAEAGAWIRDGKPASGRGWIVVGPDDLVAPYDSTLRKRHPRS